MPASLTRKGDMLLEIIFLSCHVFFTLLWQLQAAYLVEDGYVQPEVQSDPEGPDPHFELHKNVGDGGWQDALRQGMVLYKIVFTSVGVTTFLPWPLEVGIEDYITKYRFYGRLQMSFSSKDGTLLRSMSEETCETV